jgi:hypothetical protein
VRELAKGDICCVCGSEKGVRKFKGDNKWYCSKHFEHMRKHGHILERTIYDPNDIILYNNYAEIVLYNKRCEEVGRVIIDLDDVEKCKEYKWYLKTNKDNDKKYAINKNGNKTIYMHNHIFGFIEENKEVDHIDSNGLNNKKENLRISTHQQNGFNCKLAKNNKSGITGVYERIVNGKWCATIKANNKKIHLGDYANKTDAIIARLKAEKEYFGVFAPQKHLFEQYGID